LYKQPQRYDTSFKNWLSQQAEDILPLLVPDVKYEETLTVEAHRSMMRADKVFKVQKHGKEYILHIEFETGTDGQLPSRLLVYNAALYHEYHLPVITLVIYPFKAKVAVPPLVICDAEEDILIFHFKTLVLSSLNAETCIQQHQTCMYPLLPTMQGLNAEMVTQVMSELSELYRDDEVTLAQQFVCIKLLLERTNTIQPLEKGQIQERLAMFDKLWDESPMVQKMQKQMQEKYYEEGKVENAQSMLLEVVRVKFPELTEFAQQQVKLYNKPDALDLLFRKVLTAPDAKTAQWLLESTPEQ
jgi:hypothetical protein